MHLKRPVIHGLLVTGLLTGLGRTPIAHDDDHPPSSAQSAFAQQTSDLLLATLLVALTQEFDETTVANVEEGKQSISLVFTNRNQDMWLIGTFGPLQANNRSHDAFERKAHRLALTGQTYTAVQRAAGTLCYTNFPPGPTPDWMGTRMLRVPIE
jgi:hypothetical protein